MSRLRVVLAASLSFSLLTLPVLGAPTNPLGTVVFAERARVGATSASVGSTLFGGDQLATEKTGSVQMRAGAARFLLGGGSVATLGEQSTMPSANLKSGDATFSTANANAFELYAGTAVIRPATDEPTIGHVTMVNAKEFIVKSTRGSLSITVEDDSRIIPEGMAYRVVLDAAAAEAAEAAQGPRGAGGRGSGGGPRKAGSSKFIWYAIAIAGAATFFGVHAALESPDRP